MPFNRITNQHPIEVFMKQHEAKLLKLGLYKINWKKKHGGGTSLAAIGMIENGDRWLAPVNWIRPTEKQDVWKWIKSVEIIAAYT